MAERPATPTGWSGDGTAIERIYRFADFPQAIGFMMEAAPWCEAAGHHPEWSNVWNRVAVRLTTHDAGGVTEKDIALAGRFDAIYASRRIG
jgi:4a-hydroxytetrahydrobiopterin dehydratase